MDDDRKIAEALHSMTQSASDIQRLCMNIALNRRIGADWRLDIIRRAEHIAEQARKLGKES